MVNIIEKAEAFVADRWDTVGRRLRRRPITPVLPVQLAQSAANVRFYPYSLKLANRIHSSNHIPLG